jgi:hypothetical protein
MLRTWTRSRARQDRSSQLNLVRQRSRPGRSPRAQRPTRSASRGSGLRHPAGSCPARSRSPGPGGGRQHLRADQRELTNPEIVILRSRSASLYRTRSQFTLMTLIGPTLLPRGVPAAEAQVKITPRWAGIMEANELELAWIGKWSWSSCRWAIPPVGGPRLADQPTYRDDGVGQVEESRSDPVR